MICGWMFRFGCLVMVVFGVVYVLGRVLVCYGFADCRFCRLFTFGLLIFVVAGLWVGILCLWLFRVAFWPAC